jgi:hypothetical protein
MLTFLLPRALTLKNKEFCSKVFLWGSSDLEQSEIFPELYQHRVFIHFLLKKFKQMIIKRSNCRVHAVRI